MITGKSGSPKIAVRILTVLLLACLVVDGGIYWVINWAAAQARELVQAQPTLSEIETWAATISLVQSAFWPYVVPASLVFFGLLALLQWITLRRAFRRAFTATGSPKPTRQPTSSKAAIEKETEARHKRFFLHLFGVLQREGRLMDFFSEDLTQYQDAQIGAAVRNIQEDCKKSIEKYLAPRPVLDQPEGEQMTVEPGFDPQALKLTGNVTGEPPFKAVIRHRGWRADKLELPTLAGEQAPGIIAPAEVEVI